jgi:hypothetical protein
MKKATYIAAFILSLISAFIGGRCLSPRMSQSLLDEINSFAGSNFDFANYEFFRNLERKEVILYNMAGVSSRTNVGEYSLLIVPVSTRRDNSEGQENQIAHRNGAAVTFAADQLLHGDKDLGFAILSAQLQLYPNYYLGSVIADKNKISVYFPEIEKYRRGKQSETSLLEAEASQYGWKRETYVTNKPGAAAVPSRMSRNVGLRDGAGL